MPEQPLPATRPAAPPRSSCPPRRSSSPGPPFGWSGRSNSLDGTDPRCCYRVRPDTSSSTTSIRATSSTARNGAREPGRRIPAYTPTGRTTTVAASAATPTHDGRPGGPNASVAVAASRSPAAARRLPVAPRRCGRPWTPVRASSVRSGKVLAKCAPAPSNPPAATIHSGGRGVPGRPSTTKAGSAAKEKAYGSTDSTVDFNRQLYSSAEARPAVATSAAAGPDKAASAGVAAAASTAATATVRRETSRAGLVPPAEREGAVLVDLGCGAGLMAPYLQGKGYRHVGVDLVVSALEQAASHGVVAVRGDVTRLPLADGCADVVCAGEILEHVTDLRSTVAEMCRILRPGGLLVLDTLADTALCRFVAVTLAERFEQAARGIHDPDLFVDPGLLTDECAQHGVALEVRGVRPAAGGMLRWMLRRRGRVRIVPTRSTAVLFQGRGIKEVVP